MPRTLLALAAAALFIAPLFAATESEFRAVAADASGPPSRDREAILAMAGCFEIDFDFRETVALVEGYELHKPYHEIATEWVAVVSDEPGRIALQHLLVVDGDKIVKHWRQEWVYECRELLEFRDRRTWVRRTLTEAEARGTWTQKVYQTDDSPRYQAAGRWVHTANLSVWEGAPTRRPLPRREYTKRDDYQALGAVNRHVVTPTGWAHEQDNTKLVVDDNGGIERALVREVGLNTYKRIDAKFGEPGRAYWAKQGRYWGEVVAVWDEVFARGATLVLADKVGGESHIRKVAHLVYDMAQSGEAFDAGEVRRRVREAIGPYVGG